MLEIDLLVHVEKLEQNIMTVPISFMKTDV